MNDFVDALVRELLAELEQPRSIEDLIEAVSL